MSEVLILNHSLAHIMTELFDLFSYISQESVAGPSSNKHDGINRDFGEVHRHSRSRSERMCSAIFRVEAEARFPNGGCSCSDGFHHVISGYGGHTTISIE